MVEHPFESPAFMNEFTPEELEVLRPLFQPVELPLGATLFEQGAPATQFFIVADGEVVIRYKPDDGPLMILARVRKDGLAGWSAAIGNPTYTSSAVCAVESRVWCVRSENLRRFCDQYPVLGKRILERLVEGVGDLGQNHPEILSLLQHGMHIPL